MVFCFDIGKRGVGVCSDIGVGVGVHLGLGLGVDMGGEALLACLGEGIGEVEVASRLGGLVGGCMVGFLGLDAGGGGLGRVGILLVLSRKKNNGDELV